jgi:metal-responsive CopG/Arc/MetJ family transcriptional regulator
MITETLSNPPRNRMPPKIDDESPSVRLQVIVPASLVERLDAWRRRQRHRRIPSTSEAIRLFIERGLEEDEKRRGRGE